MRPIWSTLIGAVTHRFRPDTTSEDPRIVALRDQGRRLDNTLAWLHTHQIDTICAQLLACRIRIEPDPVDRYRVRLIADSPWIIDFRDDSGGFNRHMIDRDHTSPTTGPAPATGVFDTAFEQAIPALPKGTVNTEMLLQLIDWAETGTQLTMMQTLHFSARRSETVFAEPVMGDLPGSGYPEVRLVGVPPRQPAN